MTRTAKSLFVGKLFGTRVDWIIAAGRVLLALFGLFALWADPSQPARFADLAYTIMAGYVVFALFILVDLRVQPFLSDAFALFVQLADLSAFSAVMYLTEGPTSPFFVFFTFSLIAAALRWGWRGVLWTTIASLVVLVALAWTARFVIEEPGIAIFDYVIRSVYLIVAGLLLAYLAAHEAQIRMAVTRLASRLPAVSPVAGLPVHEAIEFVAEVLDAKRILFAWSEKDEPWLRLAFWNQGELVERTEAPDRFDPLVAPELSRSSFFSLAITYEGLLAVHQGGGRFRYLKLPAIHRGLRDEFAIERLVSVPLVLEGLEARLFILDSVAHGADYLRLAELAAVRIVSLFQQHRQLQQLTRAATNEERLRIARDIHDSALQFLAGAGLHLQTVAVQIPTDPERAAQQVNALQRSLVDQQRHLRTLVNRLRTPKSESQSRSSGAAPVLGPLVEHLRQQWGILVNLRIEPADAMLGASLDQEVSRILSEAVANARRHGGAASVDIVVRVTDHDVELQIEDDGRGCPVRGHYDLATLQDRDFGPRTIRERVVAREGSLTLDSRPSGTRIEIRLPAWSVSPARTQNASLR